MRPRRRVRPTLSDETRTLRDRRRAVRAELVAGGMAEAAVTATYEMTQGNPADRLFTEEVVKSGFAETDHMRWPTEVEALADNSQIIFRDGDHNAVYRLKDGTLVYASVGYGTFFISVAGPTREAAEATFAVFRAIYPASYLAVDGDARVPITFWTMGDFGPVSRLRKIESSTWSEVEGNYSQAIRDELASLMAWNEPAAEGQLLLWQGPPGTGKTWALRALASEWSSWAEFHYITDPDTFFVDNPSYMIDVLLSDSYEVIEAATGDIYDEQRDGQKWRVLILEDTGELLAANAKEAYGQGLSRLLNVVDGMIGQGLRVLVLVTTNDELGDLHPAVSRPGRCAAQIEFGPLSAEEASEWLGAETDEGGTVAELYDRQASVQAAAAFEIPEVPELGLREHPGYGHALEAIEVPADGTVVELAADPTMPPMPPEMMPNDDRQMPEPSPQPETPTTPIAKAAQRRWEGILVVEDKLTDDGRYIEPGAVTWRELPLTLLAQLETAEGHDGAQVCGRIDEIWREGNLVMGRGVFDAGDFGEEIARMVDERVLRGNSVDLAVREFELAYRDEFDDSGHRIAKPETEATDEDEGDILDMLFGQDMVVVFTDAVIGASTVCSFPAFEDASISLVGSVARWKFTAQSQFVITEDPAVETVLEPITASAAGLAPEVPPAEWFDNPNFDGPTPLTIDEHGRVAGHAALWDVCHIGIPDVCTVAPQSNTNYAYFLLKEVEAGDGERLPCGTITLGTGHADRHLGRQAAAEHYDNTGTAAADVNVGEDEHGIWVAGALRANLDSDKVREFRGAVLSGDWRNVNGNLELVGLLAVNIPGFPVPRTQAIFTADEAGAHPLAIVAAGVFDRRVQELSAEDLAKLSALRTIAHGGLAALNERAHAVAA